MKVINISNDKIWLTVGKCYDILRKSPFDKDKKAYEPRILIECDDGMRRWVYADDFTLADWRDNLINSIIYERDKI